jgi:hypothetical protein
MFHKAGDLLWPLAIGLTAGILKLILIGSGKTKTQLLRWLAVSVICGVLAGVALEGIILAEGLKALIISLAAILSGDIIEGLLKLSASFKSNPKGMIHYILDLRLKFFK